MPAPPNILILMADQLTAGVLPAYGGQRRQDTAPRCAGPGRGRVRVFYCNSPLCAPSRFSCAAGQLPSRIGAYDNAAEFPAQVPTFAHYLRRAGYQTVLSGKMHFCGPDQLHGFEERLTTDIYPADFGWTPDWTRFEERPGWYHTMDSVTAGRPLHAHQSDRLRRRGRRRRAPEAVRHRARQGPAPVLPGGIDDAPARSVRDPRAVLEPLPRQRDRDAAHRVRRRSRRTRTRAACAT